MAAIFSVRTFSLALTLCASSLTFDLPSCREGAQWDGGLGQIRRWDLLIAVIKHIHPQVAGSGRETSRRFDSSSSPEGPVSLDRFSIVPQVVQHVGCYRQRVAGGVVEHRVSAAPSRLGDVRREVVEPVCQVGVREQPRPARAETSATLQHDRQLIGDPSAIVIQFL